LACWCRVGVIASIGDDEVKATRKAGTEANFALGRSGEKVKARYTTPLMDLPRVGNARLKRARGASWSARGVLEGCPESLFARR
jgi:hypothetical protein